MNPVTPKRHVTLSRLPSTLDHTVACVLVMDDDEMIRNLSAGILERIGYNVTTCTKGEEAIELYKNAKQYGTPYLTVIIDLMILGGMGGQETAKEILRIDPGAKLIVSSGNSASPVMADYKSYGFHASLPKPYRISDLATILESLYS